MYAITVKNTVTKKDNYKKTMSLIVVILLATLTLISICSAIDQFGGAGLDSILRDITHFIINDL